MDSANATSPLQCTIYGSTPLHTRSTTKEIRLLKIFPGQCSEPLRLELSKAELTKDLEFAALSYAWSDEGTEVSIRIGDQYVTVSETLHHALLRLRDPYKESVFWIDAICIDQSSIEERNHQVPLMRDIYTFAHAVFIWLGDASEKLDLAVKFLDYIGAKESKNYKVDKFNEVAHLLDDSPDATAALEAGLGELIGKRWFSRCWILQEAALPSKEPVVLCGRHRISWKHLESLQEVLRDLMSHPGPSPDIAKHRNHHHEEHTDLFHHFHMWNFQDINTVRQMLQERRPCGLRLDQGLFLTKGASASDPRDRVYGLLGLVCPGHGVQITVDYNKSVAETFRDAAKAIIMATKSLSLLALTAEELPTCTCLDVCSCNPDFSSRSGSSWIPDFSVTDTNTAFPHSTQKIPHFRTRCGPPADMGESPDWKFEESSLFSQGLFVDVIEHTVNCLDYKEDYAIYKSIDSMLKFLGQHARVSSHQGQQENESSEYCAVCQPKESHLRKFVQLGNYFHNASWDAFIDKDDESGSEDTQAEETESEGTEAEETKPEQREPVETGMKRKERPRSQEEEMERSEMEKKEIVEGSLEASTAKLSLKLRPSSEDESSDSSESDNTDTDITTPATELSTQDVSEGIPKLFKRGGLENFNMLEHAFPESLKIPAREVEKCGLYCPRGSQPTDFWEAVWRTLTGDRYRCINRTRPGPWQGDRLLMMFHHQESEREWVEHRARTAQSAEKSGQSVVHESDSHETESSRAVHPDLKDDLRDIEQVLSSCVCGEHIRGCCPPDSAALLRRRLFTTKDGWMGFGHTVLQPGDIVVILFGGEVPCILRPVGDHYMYLGDCYLQGLMNGEVAKNLGKASKRGNGEVEDNNTAGQAYGEYVTKEFEIR